MYPVSQAYRAAIDGGAPQHIRCIIRAGESELHFGYGYNNGEIIGSPGVDRQCVESPDVYAFGQLYVGSAEVTISADSVDESIFEGGELLLSFGVEIAGSAALEWVPLGIWDISEAVCEARNGTVKQIRVRGLDKLNRLKQPAYDGISVLYLQDIMDIITERTGLQFAQTEQEIRALMSGSVPILRTGVWRPKMAATYWDEISQIAQLLGGFAVADREGKILFVRPQQTAVLTIPANRRFTATISEKNVAPMLFSYIADGYGEAVYSGYGAEVGLKLSFANNGYIFYYDENSFVDYVKANWLAPISYNYQGIRWYPGTISWYGDPALDLGDTVLIGGGVAGEESKKFIVCTSSWRFRSPQTLISPGAPRPADSSSSSGGSGSSSSASYVQQARPKVVNTVVLDNLLGDLYPAERTVARGGYSAGADGWRFAEFGITLKGNEDGEVGVKIYHDEIAQDYAPQQTLHEDEYAALHIAIPISSYAGSHTLRLAAYGEAEVVDVKAYVWGQELCAVSPEYVSASYFTYTVEDGEAVVTGYTGASLYPEIPSKLGGYPVTAIGEEAFTESNITAVYIPEGVTEIRSRSGLLPPEYQQVEYLQSDGNQWITTPFKLTDTYAYEVEAEFASEELFGMANRNDLCFYGINNKYRIYQNQYNYFDSTIAAGTRAIFSCDKSTNRAAISTTTETFAQTFTISPDMSRYPFMLFSSWSSYYDGLWRKGTGKIYGAYFRSISGDTVTQEGRFVPCYRKADSKPGMYDVINGLFYPNEGSGEFVVGPDGGGEGDKTGALMNAHDLATVYIPRSCESIGEWAFTNTALKKVRIPEDCDYYETSFPPSCEVEFYGGGGDYGQLYDSEDYAIVDAGGARLYV